jgi:hypothetical protein
MPIDVYIIVSIISILILGVILVKKLKHEGGNVNSKKHDDSGEVEPLQVIVKFEEPLEVNVNVTIINPEPEVKGILKLGPVSEKKI